MSSNLNGGFMYLSVGNVKDSKMQYAIFIKQTYESILLLHRKGFHGQSLVVFYSAIETLGLLMAKVDVVSASSHTFKSWVKEYLLPCGDYDFDESDMWGARCAVLHTFTTESDLSRANKLKQMQYVAEGAGSTLFEVMKQAASTLDGGGKHVLVDLKELYISFGEALENSTDKLIELTAQDDRYDLRVGKLLQAIAIPKQ